MLLAKVDSAEYTANFEWPLKDKKKIPQGLNAKTSQLNIKTF